MVIFSYIYNLYSNFMDTHDIKWHVFISTFMHDIHVSLWLYLLFSNMKFSFVINIFFKLKYRYWWNVAETVSIDCLVVVEDVKNLINFIQSLINIIACLIAISHGDVLLCFGDHLCIMSLSHILVHRHIRFFLLVGWLDAKIICILFLFIIPSINYQSTRKKTKISFFI